MNKIKYIFSILFSLFTFFTVQAQPAGALEVLGSVMEDGEILESANIKVYRGNELVENLLTAANGKFIINLELQTTYTLEFAKDGLATKSVSIDTKVPKEEENEIIPYKFKIDLFKIPESYVPDDKIEKPVTRIAYNDQIGDFDYDVQYTRQRQQEIEFAKKEMASKLLAEEKAKRDAEARAKADSIAKAQAELKAKQEAEEKAKQEALAAAAFKKQQEDEARRKQVEEEQARLKAEAELKAKEEAEEKARLAAEAKAKREAEEVARLEALRVQDSIKKAEDAERARLAELKAKEDAEEKARLAAEAKAKREAEEVARLEALRVQDSIKKAEDAERARLAELKAKEDAEEKARLAAEAKAKRDAEEAEQVRLAELKAKQEAEERARIEAEAKARREAEIQAQKDALAKMNAPDKNKKEANTMIPVFVDRNYPEGITEETENESNRTIYKTIVKRSTTTDVFYKLVYNWGGVYYFKNELSLTEATYLTEIKNVKNQLKN
ncbi:MAG TPA: hypothetical protein PKM16_02520 [Bacteroidia bacterium]|nr:hypothetical protein [Bacteroidia bacterium]